MIDEHVEMFLKMKDLVYAIDEVVKRICECIKARKCVYVFGNGGSASQAQHFAAEFVVRFRRERKGVGLPAIALTADTSILTACSNDYSFDDVFAVQICSLAKAGDILIGISTSGNSENVIRGFKMGRDIGTFNIALLGGDGGKIGKAEYIDKKITVPAKRTDIIQVGHLFVIHYICNKVEEFFYG